MSTKKTLQTEKDHPEEWWRKLVERIREHHSTARLVKVEPSVQTASPPQTALPAPSPSPTPPPSTESPVPASVANTATATTTATAPATTPAPLVIPPRPPPSPYYIVPYPPVSGVTLYTKQALSDITGIPIDKWVLAAVGCGTEIPLNNIIYALETENPKVTERENGRVKNFRHVLQFYAPEALSGKAKLKNAHNTYEVWGPTNSQKRKANRQAAMKKTCVVSYEKSISDFVTRHSGINKAPNTDNSKSSDNPPESPFCWALLPLDVKQSIIEMVIKDQSNTYSFFWFLQILGKVNSEWFDLVCKTHSELTLFPTFTADHINKILTKNTLLPFKGINEIDFNQSDIHFVEEIILHLTRIPTEFSPVHSVVLSGINFFNDIETCKKLVNIKSLKKLFVDNTNITGEAIKILSSGLPNCYIDCSNTHITLDQYNSLPNKDKIRANHLPGLISVTEVSSIPINWKEQYDNNLIKDEDLKNVEDRALADIAWSEDHNAFKKVMEAEQNSRNNKESNNKHRIFSTFTLMSVSYYILNTGENTEFFSLLFSQYSMNTFPRYFFCQLFSICPLEVKMDIPLSLLIKSISEFKFYSEGVDLLRLVGMPKTISALQAAPHFVLHPTPEQWGRLIKRVIGVIRNKVAEALTERQPQRLSRAEEEEAQEVQQQEGVGVGIGGIGVGVGVGLAGGVIRGRIAASATELKIQRAIKIVSMATPESFSQIRKNDFVNLLEYKEYSFTKALLEKSKFRDVPNRLIINFLHDENPLVDIILRNGYPLPLEENSIEFEMLARLNRTRSLSWLIRSGLNVSAIKPKIGHTALHMGSFQFYRELCKHDWPHRETALYPADIFLNEDIVRCLESTKYNFKNTIASRPKYQLAITKYASHGLVEYFRKLDCLPLAHKEEQTITTVKSFEEIIEVLMNSGSEELLAELLTDQANYMEILDKHKVIDSFRTVSTVVRWTVTLPPGISPESDDDQQQQQGEVNQPNPQQQQQQLEGAEGKENNILPTQAFIFSDAMGNNFYSYDDGFENNNNNNNNNNTNDGYAGDSDGDEDDAGEGADGD